MSSPSGASTAAHRCSASALLLFATTLGACDSDALPSLMVPSIDLKMVRADDFGFEPLPPSCVDRLANGAETDIDCGGPECGPCGDAMKCLGSTDCQSGVCAGDLCISCSDGKMNGAESDVDCGGPDCPRCAEGRMCQLGSDCASFACVLGSCGTPVSCLALHQANPALPDGTYTIDPDGAGLGAPFAVWCDMTTDKGGWTVLPLAFGDPRMWSVKLSGSQCTAGPTLDKNGYLLSFQNTSANKWSYLSMQFVPPMRVTQVMLKNLGHSTATACNNMDMTYTVTPASTNDETAESWYFAGPDPTVPLGYTFADGCNSPLYSASGGQPPECSMMTTDKVNQITRTITLSKPAAALHMVVVEGCQSSVCDANTGQAERFLVNHPGVNGQWKDGILVR